MCRDAHFGAENLSLSQLKQLLIVHLIERDAVYDWKYFPPAAISQTSPFLPSVSLSHSLTYTLTPHTLSMFQNAWWPIYYWRGTPTDKQIPRNEVI